jgi:phage shock protein PspC (stress-responsive transcriptional regulator)
MTSVPPPDEPRRQQQSPSASEAPSGSSSFFRWLRGLGVTRTTDRWIGGVSGGIALRTGLDLALVRGLIVVLSVFGGIGVLLYGLAWALLPEPDGRIHAEQAARGSWVSGMTGASAFVILGLVRPGLPFGEGNGLLWTLFWIGAVGLVVYWLINRSQGGRPYPWTPGGGTAGPGPAPGGGSPGGRGDGPAGGSAPGDGQDARAWKDGAPRGTSAPGPTGGSAPDATAGSVLPSAFTEGTATDHLSVSAPRTHPLPYQPTAGMAAYGDYPLYSRTPVASYDDVTEPPVVRRPRPSGAVTALLVGAASITAGTLLVLDYTGVLDLTNPTVVALAAASVILALGVIGLGLRGRSSGFVGFAATATIVSALVSSFAVVGGTWMVAQEARNIPASLQVATEGYSALASRSTVDLADLPRPERDVTVPVSSLVSDVTVIVPDGIPVEVRIRSLLGNAQMQGEVAGSDGPGLFRGSGGAVFLRGTSTLNDEAQGATLILDVRNALGQVTVLTASDEDPTRSGGAR